MLYRLDRVSGVPIVTVQRDQALLIEHQVRCAAHRLRHALVKVLEGEQEIPGQKALLALHHPAGDDEARLFQRLEHVGKDALDGGHALHLVERVFEARLCRVKLAQLRHACGRQRFKKDDDAADGFFCRGRGGAQRLFHGGGFTGR